jgi:hypothetical protein
MITPAQFSHPEYHSSKFGYSTPKQEAGEKKKGPKVQHATHATRGREGNKWQGRALKKKGKHK